MPRVTTCIWFAEKAEEAARFYVELIPGSAITSIARYPAGSPGEEGTVMSVSLTLAGRELLLINGGPLFPLSEAVSLMIEAANQPEIDRYWEALTADGGQESQCGWLKDRWGLSWQVVPPILQEWLADPDPEAAARTFAAMGTMTKLDLAALRRAHAGR